MYLVLRSTGIGVTEACELLGANLNYKDKENFKPYFKHPISSKPIYVHILHL